MKKTLCLFICMLLLCGAYAEPAPETVTLGFEDGFCVELPAGWLYYPVDQEMADQGVLYRLSDAAAARWLYIQSWNSACADTGDLKHLIEQASSSQNAGIYTFENADFVIYDMPDGDVSCCATLLDGRVINFVFTPQSDAEFMGMATQIVSSFALLDE